MRHTKPTPLGHARHSSRHPDTLAHRIPPTASSSRIASAFSRAPPSLTLPVSPLPGPTEAKLGIFSLLHEQCRLPRSDDAKFVEAVRTTHAAHPSLVAPRLPRDVFGVRHYAGTVTYSGEGFVHKNRDSLSDDLLSLIADSKCPFTRKLLTADSGGSSGGGGGGSGASGRSGGGAGGGSAGSSLCLQFKSQLTALLGTIALGPSHYVRCVTPNPAKQPGVYDRRTMLHQLRCSGLMDAVRVAREGYPSRLAHVDFLDRYRCLALHLRLPPPQPQATTAAIAADEASADDGGVASARAASAHAASAHVSTERLIEALREHAGLRASLGGSSIALGRTKVLLQLEPFQSLEGLRSAVVGIAATQLQTIARRHAAAVLRRCALAAVVSIQRIARGVAARAIIRSLRRQRACTVLQAAAVAMLERRRRASARLAIDSSSKLVAAWRRHTHRRSLAACRRAAVHVQTAARRRGARAVMRSRRTAARDVTQLREDNERLRSLLKEAQRVDEAGQVSGSTSEREAEMACEMALLREQLEQRTAEVERLRSLLEAPTASSDAGKPPLPHGIKEDSDTTAASGAPTTPSRKALRSPVSLLDKENGETINGTARERATLLADQPSAQEQPPSPRLLSRTMVAEQEVERLKDELRLAREELHAERQRHSQREASEVTGRETGRETGAAREVLAAPRTELEQQPPLDVDFATARKSLDELSRQHSTAQHKSSRQERIIGKLMKELREEKTKRAAEQTANAVLERLGADLTSMASAASARMQALEANLPASLIPAADRLASAVAADASDASAVARELEAAAAASALEALMAEEAREESEVRAERLEQRAKEQARLIDAMLRRHEWEDAAAGAQTAALADEVTTRLGAEGDGEVEADGGVAREEGAPPEASPSGLGRRLTFDGSFSPSAAIGALAHSVRRVASAAATLYTPGAEGAGEGRGGGGGDGIDGGGRASVYVGLLEEELTRTLEKLEAQKEVCRMLSHEVASREVAGREGAGRDTDADSDPDESAGSMEDGAVVVTDGEAQRDRSTSEPAEAALAAAVAAADALIFADAADDGRTEAGSNDTTPHHAAPTSPTAGRAYAIEAVQQRAAAAELLEELRQESAKSTRLERIIARLMTELRQTKVQLASGGLEAGQLALAAFDQDVARIEKALHQNSTAVAVLDDTVRKGLQAAAIRLQPRSGGTKC